MRTNPKAAKPEQIIIQVKGGKPGVKDMHDLRGVIEREKAALGVLISLRPHTTPMEAEATGSRLMARSMSRVMRTVFRRNSIA